MNIRDWFIKYEKLIMSLLMDKDNGPELLKCGIVQNFTTKKFCKQTIGFCEEEENYNDRTNTNKELLNFFQSVYHAGTIPQFLDYARIPDNLDTQILTTFHYLFDVFKKGIYVQIKNKNINVYLPFSNTNYRNDWGDNLRLKIGGSSREVVELEEKNHWNPNFIDQKYHTMIQRDPNKWYANYCFFRNTVYKNGQLRLLDDEGDKSVNNFLQLITEVCYQKNVPDVCFFISPRDFPIVRKDKYHPYDRLYHGKPAYLGDMYPNLTTIFSQSITSDYADELIPNDDDIVNILCDKRELYQTNWSKKKPIAVFRGSATGCGVRPDNNPRLMLYELAKHSDLLDVKLIGLNDKIKVDENGIVSKINIHNYPKMDKKYKEQHKLSPKQQSEYKYIIHVEGHVAAFRLTRELAYGSVILKVDSRWKTWYSDELVGWSISEQGENSRKIRDSAHYIRIKSDLSDLITTIEWCKANNRNDQICKNIAERARTFWETHFDTPEYMINYTFEKLKNLSKIQSGVENKYSGLIIIPYRENEIRKKQLRILLDFFDKNLDNRLKYILSVQKDNKPFNRGRLLNEAVKANKQYDYFIFHDCDLLPDTELLEYYYQYPVVPLHLGYRGQRYSKNIPISWPKNKFIGGVLSVNKFDFFLVNGFPNNFWGWGGEDDALSYRFHINGIQIDFPETGSVKDLEDLDIPSKLEQLKLSDSKNKSKDLLLEEDIRNWYNNGVNQEGENFLYELV